MKIKHLLTLAFSLLLSSSLSAQIFYKIEGNGLQKPSYIFGSHHMAPISILDLYNIPEYIQETEQVVGEIDMTQDPMALALAMQSHMMAPADSTLSKVIPAEKYDSVNEVFKKYAPIPGADLSMFEPLKPMVIQTMIVAGIMSELMPEFDPNNQLDASIMKLGKEDNKKVIGLESPEFQANLLYEFTPIAVQAENLVEMAENPEKSLEEAQKLNDAYLNGNLDAMLSLSDDNEPSSEFEIALVDKRNANWIDQLPSILSEGPTFIVVGALHLAGEKGVVEGLRNQGYSVSPIEVVVPAMQ